MGGAGGISSVIEQHIGITRIMALKNADLLDILSRSHKIMGIYQISVKKTRFNDYKNQWEGLVCNHEADASSFRTEVKVPKRSEEFRLKSNLFWWLRTSARAENVQIGL